MIENDNNNKAKQILIKARDLILNKEHWTKGALFRDKFGNPTEKETACKFCSVGAILRVCNSKQYFFTNDPPPILEYLAKNALSAYVKKQNLNPNGIITYNDSTNTTHEDIINVFNGAINSL